MLSSLPKLLDRQFVFGYLLPIIAFAFCGELALRPWSEVVALAVAMGSEKELGGLAVMLAALWFAAAGLMLLNRLLQRFVAGYAWPFEAWWGKRRLLQRWDREADAINREAARIEGFPDPPSAKEAVEIIEHNKRLFDFRRTFPRERDQVLGTLYGNALRAYERYPNRVYGVDGVALWPRLGGVIPKDFNDKLADAQAQVDCFINLSLLAALLALLVAVWTATDLVYRAPGAFGALTLRGAWVLASVGAARLFYRLAIERAVAEGELVRAAFDLYLPKLIPALGFTHSADRAGQAELLDEVKRASLYHLPLQRPWSAAPAVDPGAGKPSQPSQPADDAEG